MRRSGWQAVMLWGCAIASGCAAGPRVAREERLAPAQPGEAPALYVDGVAGLPNPTRLGSPSSIGVVARVVADGPDDAPAAVYLAAAQAKATELGCAALVGGALRWSPRVPHPADPSEGGSAAWDFLCIDRVGELAGPESSGGGAGGLDPSEPVKRFHTLRCDLEEPSGSHIGRMACFSRRSGRLVPSQSPEYMRALASTPHYLVKVRSLTSAQGD
jgi:hypothetical protein